ncbi:hypothetical protein AWZ03_015382, partial [Drosophila navojoa]
MLKTDVSLAGKMAEANLLIMPTMLDHVILGMDFLCAIGTKVRCGNAELEMRMVDDLVEGASPSPSSKQGVKKSRSEASRESCEAEQDFRGGPEERPPEIRSVELEEEGEPGGSS